MIAGQRIAVNVGQFRGRVGYLESIDLPAGLIDVRLDECQSINGEWTNKLVVRLGDVIPEGELCRCDISVGGCTCGAMEKERTRLKLEKE